MYFDLQFPYLLPMDNKTDDFLPRVILKTKWDDMLMYLAHCLMYDSCAINASYGPGMGAL
jgi:hypothetical protein